MMNENLSFIQAMSEGIAQIIRVILFFALWNRFVCLFDKRDRTSKSEAAILAMALILVGAAFRLGFDSTWPFPGIAQFTVIMIFTVWRKRDDIRETVFSCLLYLNFRYLSYFVVNSVTSLISYPVMQKALESDDIESFVAKWVDILYLITSLAYVAVIAVMALPVIFLVKKRINISWSETGYLSVMNIAGIALTRIMMRLSVIKLESGAVILTEERPELLWQLPLIGFLLYLGELSAVFIWQRYDMYREQGEMYYAENMEKEAIRKRLKETEDYYGRIRSVRHEMANHMMTIKGLADGGHNKELSDYIAKISDAIEPVSLPFSTGSPVTDVVLGDKHRTALDAGISCDFRFVFDDGWGIPVYDISIVLSNILDNAAEAASSAPKGKRYIELRLIEKEKLILIRCENSYDAASQKTVKQKDAMWHGIGLKNIGAIASRYEGAVDISQKGSAFIISVMLKKNPRLT